MSNMFGTKLDIEASCLDPQCSGTFVAQFEDKIGVTDDLAYCCECEHAYTVLRKNFSDTPEDEIAWSINPHND